MRAYNEIIEEIRNKIKSHEEAVEAMENELVQAQKALQESIDTKQAAAASGEAKRYENEAQKADYWKARIEALKLKLIVPAIGYDETIAYSQELNAAYKQAVHPLYKELHDLILQENDVFRRLNEISNATAGLPYIRVGTMKQGKATYSASFPAYYLPQTLIKHRDHAEYVLSIVTDKSL